MVFAFPLILNYFSQGLQGMNLEIGKLHMVGYQTGIWRVCVNILDFPKASSVTLSCNLGFWDLIV